MFSSSNQLKFLVAMAMLCLPASFASAQAYKAQVGFTDLQSLLGGSIPTGAGLDVMMAEAPVSSGNFLPDGSEAQFTGKRITNGSGASGVSSHATLVARNYFGNTSSMTPGITTITAYDANDYLGNVLGFNSGNDPLATTAYDIGNHSYIGLPSGTFTAAVAEDILERFDFVINRDNTVMAVGANNGATSTNPRVLGPSYNAITVGRSDGSHSQGLTPNYGAPRFAVEIVVPAAGATSFSTPVVSSAAALLKDAGSGTDFVQNEVIRATLFAGATKEEFGSWDKTATRPLDEVFGFGELNIFNSYNIFAGGQFDASTSDPASNIDLMGWDYGDFDGTTDLFYDFSIDPGEYGEISSILSWNMEITDNDAGVAFDAVRSLADLNLDLFDSSGSFLGSMIDSSNGTDYNNEHIYLQGLASGDYTFRVSGDIATDFGFAWRITSAVPEPGSLSVLGLMSLGLLIRRRRNSRI